MMVEGEIIDICDLPEHLRENPPEAIAESSQMSLQELNRRHVLHVLECAGGNKARAAKTLGISRVTLYKMLATA